MLKRFAFILLAAFLLGACFFDRLGALGLVTPDEPRYAAIARDMARSGDWVTPRLWAEPWFEKPPLYYWLAALSMRVIGTSEVSARLPSAFLAAILCVATSWVTGRLFGGSSGRFAFLLGISSLGMIVFSRAASTDMPFTATFGLAMLCLSLWLFDADRAGKRHWLLAFYAFLALATLAKGPVGIVLSGGAFLLWAAVTRKWALLGPLLHPLGLLTFLIISLPWYFACTFLHGTGFLYTFFIYHNWIRYLEPVFKHPQPFWFFWAVLPLAIFPWTMLVLFPLHRFYRLVRFGGKVAPAWPFFACWVLFALIFFSFSQSKLPGYILPCVPPLVALIATELVPLGTTSHAGRAAVVSVPLCGIGLAGFLLAAPSVLACFAVRLEMSHLIGLGTAVLLATIASIVFLYRRPSSTGLDDSGSKPQSRMTFALISLVLVAGSMVLYLNRRVLPFLDASLSARQLARSIRALSPAAPLYLSAGLPRSWQFGLEFYLDGSLPRSLPRHPSEGMRIRLLTTRRALPLLPLSGWRVADVREVVPTQEIFLLEAVAIAPAGPPEGSQGNKPSADARTLASPRPSM